MNRRSDIRIFLWIRLLALGASLGVSSAAAIAPGIPGKDANDGGTGDDVFELDRNAEDDSGAKDDDWENILKSSHSDFPITAITECEGSDCDSNYPGVLVDPPATTIFVQGSKDTLDIPDWTCRDQPSPDKNELTNAYAAAYDVNGDLIVYLGVDRFDNKGSAFMGFWLLQADVALEGTHALSCLPNGDGRFRDTAGDLVTHAAGDLLIAADFPNGGAVGVINIFEWVGDGTGSNGNLDLLFSSEMGQSPECMGAGGGDVCATVNQGSTPSPWDYTPKGATGDQPFPMFSFLEGGINLTEVFANNSITLQEGQVPCFSTFLAETRTSVAATASQKDFVIGSFNVCGIDVTKVCGANTPNTGDNPITFTYDVRGCFDNSGFGTVTNPDITDAPTAFDTATLMFYEPQSPLTEAQCGDFAALGNAINSGFLVGNPSTFDLAPAGQLVWEAQFTSTSNGPSDTVTATADGAGGATIEPATASDTCPEVQFNPELEVVKNCTARLENEETGLVVKIDVTGYVCNKGDAPLKSVTVFDSTEPPISALDFPDPILGPISLPAQQDPENPDCTSSSSSFEAYSFTYTPQTLPTPPQGEPQLYRFTDDVTATGFPPGGVAASTECPLIQGVVTCIDMDNAQCSLCPDETELCNGP